MKYKLNIQFTLGEIKESYFGWGAKVKQESRSKSLTEALEFLEVSGDVCYLRPQSSIEQRDDVKADKKSLIWNSLVEKKRIKHLLGWWGVVLKCLRFGYG